MKKQSLTLFMLKNMNDLQTVACKPSAYDPVANWNGSKQKLKEVEKQKEFGYREQDFVEAAFWPNKAEYAETNDAEQDGQQQRNEGPADEHENHLLIRSWFFLGNEIPAHGDQAEGVF